MSPLPIRYKERFVSNASRAKRGISELKAIEDSFARHLGKIEGALGPRITRLIGTTEWDLAKLRAGRTHEFGPLMFKSSYRLETNDTMVGVFDGDGKTFVNSSVGEGLPLDGKRHKLRLKTREELVNAIRSIFIDVSLIRSIDVLEMQREGVEFIDLPIKKRNNVLHLQHTILLEESIYEDQAMLLDLLKGDGEPQMDSDAMPPTWTLKPDVSLDAFANAVKFIAFDEITSFFHISHWQSRTGKKADPNLFERIFHASSPDRSKLVDANRRQRLEQLRRSLGQSAAV